MCRLLFLLLLAEQLGLHCSPSLCKWLATLSFSPRRSSIQIHKVHHITNVLLSLTFLEEAAAQKTTFGSHQCYTVGSK